MTDFAPTLLYGSVRSTNLGDGSFFGGTLRSRSRISSTFPEFQTITLRSRSFRCFRHKTLLLLPLIADILFHRPRYCLWFGRIPSRHRFLRPAKTALQHTAVNRSDWVIL